MKEYCDTHGLDLPCKECQSERFEELDYLVKIEKSMQEST